MTGATATEDEPTYLWRDRAPCKRCGEVIETDVPACPHCGNQPVAMVKRASIATILVGTILTIPAHAAWTLVGSLIGLVLLCIGVGVYWVVTDRYSPTKYDASARSASDDSGPTRS